MAAELKSHGFAYTNLGRHPDFATVAMPELAARCFLEEPSARGAVVEGVFGRRSVRVRFIRRLQELLSQGDAIRFDRIAVFGLVENAETLSQRRRRSVDQYRELLAAMEAGNPPYPHFVLDGQKLPSVSDRVQEVLRVLESLSPEQ